MMQLESQLNYRNKVSSAFDGVGATNGPLLAIASPNAKRQRGKFYFLMPMFLFNNCILKALRSLAMMQHELQFNCRNIYFLFLISPIFAFLLHFFSFKN